MHRPFASTTTHTVPTVYHKPLITVLLLGAATALTYMPGAFEFSVFDLRAIREGEWWRLLSGHLTHTNSSHLLWDLLAAAIAIGYLETHSRLLAAMAIICGALGVDLLLLSPLSGLQFYCGLSGLLFAPLSLSVVLFATNNRGLSGWLPALLCIAKVVNELFVNDGFLAESNWPAYPLAHVAGMAAGAFTFMLLLGYRRLAAPRDA